MIPAARDHASPDDHDPARRRLFGMAAAVAGVAALPPAQAMPPVQPASSVSGGGGVRHVPVQVTINGQQHRIEAAPEVTLLDLLREQLQMTGTKKGCNRGECGSCTVLLDGKRVNACFVLAATLDGRSVTTVEGLAVGGKLHPVQQAFIDCDAFQCGFCTSGQIMSAVACIREGHTGSDAEIREWMSGNLCRCAAYPQIVDAVSKVAQERRGGQHAGL